MMMRLCFNQMQMFSTDTSHLPADKVTLYKQLDRNDAHDDHEDNLDDYDTMILILLKHTKN